jgi:hypothetical protein
MAADAKKAKSAAKEAETRSRYRDLVPSPEVLDGLAPLHTLKVPYLLGRPLELIPVLLTAVTTLICVALLTVFVGMPMPLTLLIAPIVGVVAGKGFFNGDGLKVKEPYLRNKANKAVGDVVVGGPMRPSSSRYEFIQDGVPIPWEEAASEQ